MDPLVFHHHPRPQIWGERRLERHFGKELPPGTFGESWEISTHAHHVSRLAEGPLKGMHLDELWRGHGREIFGPGQAPANFPLLLKFLDCHLQLSLQVHPNDQLAARMRPGEQGKTEAWVIISAETDARIYAGLRLGVTPDMLRQHLLAGTVNECLHWLVPKAGDCLFLPAGTVHGVGGGVLMAEVQQSSDVTFRLFDWNRIGPDGKPRPLHVEESLESIDWTAGPVEPVRPRPIGNLPAGVRGEELVDCHYFQMSRFGCRVPLPLPYSGQMSIWMVLAGRAALASNAGYHRVFRAGETVLVPASANPLIWQIAAGDAATLLAVRVPRAKA